ncbi:hypothetical protein M1M34_gp081 [Haloarcula tailed virus 2]|uniref:Uncharacterized protein n=1 Tax=Haloarcula tailed virus 2 TaxID=2877989 RepID=A0AAE8XYV1_9CAUD|nr:hypothetical protein M1M34_gp081 [Haloarcula tailed virus 2]UBF23252.1 hypothetical protein HATV-2_gp101 [Haloarcula tailed virus 2]
MGETKVLFTCPEGCNVRHTAEQWTDNVPTCGIHNVDFVWLKDL